MTLRAPFPWFGGFQSTPPCGRRPAAHGAPFLLVEFQSTPPCGRRQVTPRRLAKLAMFQSTPPCGRRRDPARAWMPTRKVSIHASVREATPGRDKEIGSCVGFNPRLRAGGDDGLSRLETLRQVSIHASVREATGKLAVAFTPSGFNPRLRAGGDSPGNLENLIGDVSIHASVREATVSFRHMRQVSHGFNPRLRAGGDRRGRHLRSVPLGFNPRLRAGGDNGGPTAKGRTTGFNPRLRAGGDRGLLEEPRMTDWFQSTPPCGRRRHLGRPQRQLRAVSIHASVREATTKR